MTPPAKKPAGGKAPRPLVVNDGSGENGAGPQVPPAAQQPPVEPEATAPGAAGQPAPAEPQAPPHGPDPGPYLVELATVEALIAKEARGAARQQLLVLALAGGALLIAIAAYKRAMVAEAEALLEGAD